MTKRIQAKHKIDRRLSVNLWGREKSPFIARNYGPGQHGENRPKPTDYAVQLRAKQKIKGYYGNITEKQFRNIYKKASMLKGDKVQNMLALLESRLDTVVYRLKFASTVFAARQLVNHGHVKVNGKRVNIASACVREGDEIEVSEQLRENPSLVAAMELKERDVPEYLSADHKNLKGVFMKVPTLEEIPYPVQMDPHLVIEFYSR